MATTTLNRRWQLREALCGVHRSVMSLNDDKLADWLPRIAFGNTSLTDRAVERLLLHGWTEEAELLREWRDVHDAWLASLADGGKTL